MRYEDQAKCCHCRAHFNKSDSKRAWIHRFRSEDFDPNSAECSVCRDSLTDAQRISRLVELGWQETVSL